MTIQQARKAFDEGRIYMAQRVGPDTVDLLVKKAKKRRAARGYFSPKKVSSFRSRTETHQKIRERMGRPVTTLCGQVYASVSQAAAEVGVSTSRIRSAANGRQKTAAGFEWRFL